ncbi:hypothetical protein [Agreia sp. Leaf210]|uniref:hypothetical protein n=1 Tax=Agreia sp. Leaf210 TaxID=1735682 RepID=UPI0007136A4C|nr:hypothetical protein [Agreia sp. Leaf210]KQM58179.1 hypothetical protein ASE64_11600 [Agreia sp. Leaf210]
MTSNHDRFLQVVGTAKALISADNAIDLEIKQSALDALDRVGQLDRVRDNVPITSSVERYLDGYFGELADHVDHAMEILAGTNSREVSNNLESWFHGLDRKTLNAAVDVQADLEGDSNKIGVVYFEAISLLRSLIAELKIAERVDQFRKQTNRITSQVQVSADDAQAAAKLAQVAAGSAGEASLSLYFETYAKQQLRSSVWFRAATIATIGVAIAVAANIPHGKSEDPVAAVYRIAIVAGVAGLATYFGRQSGHYRRLGTWAKGLQIQLQSFPAFMATISDENTRNLIHEAFAKRVLGSPPEANSSGDTSAEVLTQPLIDALVRRAT